MKTNQGVCPKCESENLTWDSAEIDNEVRYPYTCEDCEFEGIEIYALNFLGHMKQSYEQGEILDFI